MSHTNRPHGSKPASGSKSTLRISSHQTALKSFKLALEALVTYCERAETLCLKIRSDQLSGSLTSAYVAANLRLPEFLVSLSNKMKAVALIVEKSDGESDSSRALEMQILSEALSALLGTVDSNNLLTATDAFLSPADLSLSLEQRSTLATLAIKTFSNSCGPVFKGNGVPLDV